jgi:hypothetical protein
MKKKSSVKLWVPVPGMPPVSFVAWAGVSGPFLHLSGVTGPPHRLLCCERAETTLWIINAMQRARMMGHQPS